MTIRNLEAFFRPRSVALIGASERKGSVGAIVTRNLTGGGYAGPIMLVNPKRDMIDGRPCYPDVASLPEAPDLAVICTPPATVPGIVGGLARRGTRGVVVITAGFGDGGRAQGQSLRQAMLDAARPHLLRVVGPNCVGIMAPAIGLNATFAERDAKPGGLAFVSQSGAVLLSIVDWAEGRGVGFSHLASVGDMSDVDFGDMLDYLAQDSATDAILLYMEAVTHARKFMSTARAASRAKPVIVMKSGRNPASASAAATHTGALAGMDEVYDAAFERAGMIRVDTLDDLFGAVEILGAGRRVQGDRLAMLTNGGGFGVMATDSLIDEGGRLADLSPETLKRLDEVLPPTWSHGNPIDIIGDADGPRYERALSALMADRGVDAVIAMFCPTALASGTDAAKAIARVVGREQRTPVIAAWIGASDGVVAGRQVLTDASVPVYDSLNGAVRAVMHMVRYHRAKAALVETPPSVPERFRPQTARARATIETALIEGRSLMTEPEAKELLDAYGIPVALTRTAGSVAGAADAATGIGYPVALKILSPDISHKSDFGGVALDIEDETGLHRAAKAMLARIAANAPQAHIDGFTVQQMIRRPKAHELLIGATVDPQFGPVILFGQGGTSVEVVADKALALPPLNMSLARDMIERTRIARLLHGYRDEAPADIDAIALTIMKVAQIVADLPEVIELDINPLLAGPDGVIALDARIKVEASRIKGTERFAIKPYPIELEERFELPDGSAMLLRPIRPEDEPRLREGFARLSAESIRMRFFAPLKTLTQEMAARLTQIDYDREMALVLTTDQLPGEAEIFAVARLSCDPDNEQAEFALIVGDDFAGQGVGTRLMTKLVAYARGRGVGSMIGIILSENKAMLSICRKLGFTIVEEPEEHDVKVARLDLQGLEPQE
ncbi:MAG: bifunctional acetate--CoA ligase family protein/GNAT family N-acetyltransferase [Proteobacteria bacterium]|nr:bifunctional acetate--CoA ligase family protein/GNAT family N-acetyltransferase [Pseudomonadota bacterium]